MDWIEKVNSALNYIEKNLYDEIQYKEIEKIILSPIEVLQRFFMLNTGTTLTEYIRRRKLNEAVKQLRNGNEKIIDIAIKFGYGSSDAFSLAFKRLYGISPSDARLSDAVLKPYPRMIFSLSITYVEGEIEMKSIEQIKPFTDELELFLMPEVRIIGWGYILNFDSDYDIKKISLDFWEMLKNERKNLLTKSDFAELPSIIPNALLGWVGEAPENSKTYTYLIAKMCPAGTPVPERWKYIDLPSTIVAKGKYGEKIVDIINKIKPLGYVTCYTDLGWNATLCFDEEEKNPPNPALTDYDRGRWLVPCMKVYET